MPTCEELKDASDAATADYHADPTPTNLKAMGEAYMAWWMQCGAGNQGGGTPLPPGGLD